MSVTDDAIRCPKDSIVMQRMFVGAIGVDRCPRCRGIWLDRGELAALLLTRGAAATVEHEDPATSVRRHQVGEARCPRDGASMREVRDRKQRHVAYEECPSCRGIFLDAGELTDLSELTLRERIAGLGIV